MVCCCCCCCCCCFCCCCCNSHVPLLAIFSYVQKYRSLQPEYRHAHYLSVVQSFPNRRLINRFRCGCHGLHVDTGRFVNTPRDDRVCEVCKSGCVENEHHFLFDCPAYAHIRYSQLINIALISHRYGLLARLKFTKNVFTSVSRAWRLRPMYIWQLCIAYTSYGKFSLQLCLHLLRCHGPASVFESVKLSRV